MIKTNIVSESIIIMKRTDSNTLRTLTLSVEQAKLLRDQLDDKIDELHIILEERGE